MSRRYLYGPVTAAFADQNLKGERQAGHCLAFDSGGETDLRIGPTDSWETICERLPEGWLPDFVAVNLWYTSVPASLWTAPVPLIGLAVDWNLLWHYYRRRLPQCELILTDTRGVEALGRAGIHQARAATLYSCSQSFMDMPLDGPRDIDILFIGNFHPAIQAERLPWLARLAQLAKDYRVVIRTGVFGDDYKKLLSRARIVFNRSIRGEANQRAFEAAAAGALLFQEAANLETPAFFRDRRECIYYTPDTLEPLLRHYLEHDGERETIASAARAKLAEFTADKLWDRQLAVIEREWPAIVERAAKRPRSQGTEELQTRVWQLMGANSGSDPTLAAGLEIAVTGEPRAAALHNALGLVVNCRTAKDGRYADGAIQSAIGYFQQALESDPYHLVAGLNLVEALVALRQNQPAADLARRLLDLLNRQPALSMAMLDCGHFPPAFDHFRAEWERAAWQNAGQPLAEMEAKRKLLRWRLHTLLADLTGELHHFEEAVIARPDLAPTRAALGCALAREGKVIEAVPHLQRAVAANPFDRQAARALYEALGGAGNAIEQRRLAHERFLLSQAAPDAVAAEDWLVPVQPTTVKTATRCEPLHIVWEGSHAALHSLALVNRELCLRLLERGHDVALAPTGADESDSQLAAMPAALRERYRKPLSQSADIHIGHQWPPKLIAPPAGHWIIMQPWEFGSLPKSWMRPMSEEVDAVWVYTQYLRECFVRSGLPADRVHVVPLGVDTKRFSPQAPPLELQTTKRFKFLFVGGTIHRKGIDVLLSAYAQAFTDADDVCLVIKDMGKGTFYRGQTAEEKIAQVKALPSAPAIEYIDRSLDDDELAGLYTACDCLAHPYRGEGFGLPIAEAMASGLPVIVTGHGAALDYCDEDSAFLIPARIMPFPENRVGDLETVGRPWLAEPDLPILRYLLRHVVDHPAEARTKAQVGCARSQLPARLSRGSRTAVGKPYARANASRGLARMNAACSAPAPSSRSMTPLSSWAVSVARRARANTSAWLPAGNRTNCRANAGPSKPKRRSSLTATLNRSKSASRRHTQLLCWPNNCAASTCVSPSSRTNACTTHASSNSRTGRCPRFSPKMDAFAVRSSISTTRTLSVASPTAGAAATRLKPSSTSNRASRTHATTGANCPQRRNDPAIASSATGSARRYRR